MKSALRSLCRLLRKEPSLFHLIFELSIPRMARFILARRQVVWLVPGRDGDHIGRLIGTPLPLPFFL
jgi:hypothetical protein